MNISAIHDLAKTRPDLWDMTGVGVTRTETVIWALTCNDACTGTGNGDTLRHYLDRPAITGHDDRNGSMALWFTTKTERMRRQPGFRLG